MDKRYLFLKVVDELAGRVQGDEYDLLKACGLLRLLFLDQEPFVHKIKPLGRGVKLRFHVNGFIRLPVGLPDLLHAYSTLLPGMGKDSKLNIDEFLSRPCMWENGIEYTIREVILFCCNRMIGIHYYDPLEKEKGLLDSFQLVTQGFTIYIGFGIVKEICSVSLNALSPLVEAIATEFYSENPSMPLLPSLERRE